MATSNNLDLKIRISADTADTIKRFSSLKKSVADTEQEFKNAQEKAKKLANELKNSDGNADQLAKQFKQATASAGQLKKQLQEQKLALQNTRQSLKEAGVDTQNLNASWKALKASLAESKQALSQTKQAVDSLGTLKVRPFKEIEAEIKQIELAYKQLKASGVSSQAELNKANLEARNRVRALKNEMNGFGQGLPQVRVEILGVLAAFAGFTAGTSEIVRVGKAFESYENTLKAVLGSQEAAQQAMQFLREESERLGTSLEVNIPAFAKLAASANGTALAGQPVKDIFTAISEASVVLGLSSEQLDGSLTAISQIMSKSTVSAEELRGQLGERLYGAFNLAAESIGITTQELDKLLKTGALSAEEFLPAFAKQIRQTFGDDVEAAVNSSRAAFERLNNALLELKLTLANGGVVDAIAALAKALTFLVNLFNDLTPASKAYIAALSALAAGTLAWRFGIKSVVAALSDLFIPAMSGATVATKRLGLAMKGLGVVGLALLIFELGSALYDYATASDDAADKTDKLNAAQKKLRADATKLETELAGLNKQRATLEQQLTDAVKEESAKRRDQQIKDGQAVVRSLQSDIDKSIALQQKYSDAIANSKKNILSIEESASDKLRRLQREELSESDKQADIQKQVTEELIKAKAAAASDPAEAARQAKKAEQLAGELTNRKALADIIKRSASIQIEAEQTTIKLAEESKAKAEEKQQELQQQLEQQKLSLDDLIAKKAELEKPVSLQINTNLDEVNQKIDDLQQRLNDLNTNIDIAGGNSNSATDIDPKAFASGGHVTGPGTATSDSIFARLSNGEYIVKAAAVNQYGVDFMHRLNNMTLPKFAAGGLISSKLFASASSLPQASSKLFGSSKAGNNVNITLPGGEKFGPFLDQDNSAAALEAALKREVFKRGRRR